MLSSEVLASQLSGAAPVSLRKGATRGALWATIQTLVNRLSGVVVFIVLARLLVPAEFGLLAAAQVFIALATTFAEAGLTRTLVQRPTLRAAHLDVALVVSSGSGLLLGGALVLSAPWVAAMYDMPALTPVLMALALVPALNGLCGVPESVLRRQLRFRTLALRGNFSVLVSGIIAVVLAVLGAGVWALVAQAVGQVAIATTILWFCVGWRPSLHWEREAFADLLGFGSHVLGISFLNFLNRRSAEFLIGLTLGPIALGLYAVAQRVLTMVLDVLVSNVQRVALPVFSKVADQPGRLAKAYLQATEATTLAALPFFTMLAALGPIIVPVLFGAQWTEAGDLMRILALAGFAQSITFFNNSMLLATGNSWLALRWSTAVTVFNLAVCAVAVQFGIVAVAVSFAVRVWMTMPIGLYFVRRVSTVTVGQQLRTLAVPAAASGCMAFVVVGGQLIWPAEQNPLLYLLAAAVAGGLVYAGVVASLRRDLTASVVTRLRRRVSRRQAVSNTAT